MTKTRHILLLGLYSLFLIAIHSQTSFCPTTNSGGSIFSQQINIGFGGAVALIQGQDTLCYNFTLQSQFSRRPGVAIAVNSFESAQSPDLFFSIKPVKTDLSGVIPFVIRTQWKYTQWSRINFRFLVQDRTDIEAGYYQLDTGILSSCSPSKSINVMIPYQQLQNFNQFTSFQSAVFLHGFQISTSVFIRSPFEVQIRNTQTNSTGIRVTLLVTSTTQVHSIFMSYIVFPSSNTQNMNVGSLQLTNPAVQPQALTNQLGSSSAFIRLHGIAGFIITQTQTFGSISLNVEWSANTNSFNFSYGNTQYQYLSYQYFFLFGNQCQFCNGHPLNHNGQCVAFCPQGTFQSNNQCIVCPQGQFWNGFACIACPNGQSYNNNTRNCECPQGSFWNSVTCVFCQSGQFWNGNACISCRPGQVYNTTTRTCNCPFGQIWNGFSCGFCNPGINCGCLSGQIWNGSACISCPQGQFWNVSRQSCSCPSGSNWNGVSCLPITTQCTGGQFFNQNSGRCQCPIGTSWNGFSCIGTIQCTGGQFFNQSIGLCQCPLGQNWNGVLCVSIQQCFGGQFFNQTIGLCQCPLGQNWNGFSCVSIAQCQTGQIWNPQASRCECPQNQFWNGTTCRSCFGGQFLDQSSGLCICPTGQSWSGSSCISCPSGKVFNFQSQRCDCPPGQFDNNGICSSCGLGQYYDENNRSCVCPNGYIRNGDRCVFVIQCAATQIFNITRGACECPVGLIWDGLVCNQQCLAPRILIGSQCNCRTGTIWNGNTCINTNNQTCNSGSIWNGYQCVPTSQCPPGTIWNGNSCQNNGGQCPINTYWNGTACVIINYGCPDGTFWQNNRCETNNTNNCPQGTYWDGYRCVWIPQNCPFGSTWNGVACVNQNNNCQSGNQYWNGSQCILFPCENGRNFNPVTFQCECPVGQAWNGNTCVICNGGRLWILGQCRCPAGLFWNGIQCVSVTPTQCGNIANAVFNGSQCVCKSGFEQQFNGNTFSCICSGLEIQGFCDRCFSLPYSQWINGLCQCVTGYVPNANGFCERSGSNPGSGNSSCLVGNYFNRNQRKCIRCSEGCLSCIESYKCSQCSTDFNYNPLSQLCNEKCGDGKRYFVECDDGNNNNFDGCSIDCKIEVGYTCVGGSPNGPDTCSSQRPSAIDIVQTGQTHIFGEIIVNVRVNYLPKQLIDEICNNRDCNGVLKVQIIDGFGSASTIQSTYTKGTTYSFSIRFRFGREPIGRFTATVRIDPSYSSFFSNINIQDVATFAVDPSYLALADRGTQQLLAQVLDEKVLNSLSQKDEQLQ